MQEGTIQKLYTDVNPPLLRLRRTHHGGSRLAVALNICLVGENPGMLRSSIYFMCARVLLLWIYTAAAMLDDNEFTTFFS